MKQKLYFLIALFSGTIFTFSQTVTTFAGSGIAASADGTGTAASFFNPTSIAVDASGTIYVADQLNHKIRKITPSGVVTTFAGSGTSGSSDGTGTAASFDSPLGIALDASGNLYVADYYNNKIRKITPSGVVTTFAGSGTAGNADGTGTAASFNRPAALTVDVSGTIYVADYLNNKIRKITPSGVVTTFAGSGVAGSLDGTGTAASFSSPSGIAVDASGNVFVADKDNSTIRKITASGVVTTFAGSPGITGSVDGVGNSARFQGAVGLCVDAGGNIYVADTYNHQIRKITSTGIVSTFAGVGAQGNADGQANTSAFRFPYHVMVNQLGDILVADAANNKIRKIIQTPATHLNFDGVDDDIVLPANIGNTLSNGTELTIEYWFKGTNVQSAVRIQGFSSNWIVAGWGASNNPMFIVSTDGGTSGVSCGGTSVVDNTWHHLAFVWKKNDIFATYLDGVLQDSRTAANVNLPVFSGVTGRIGSYNSGAEYMNGNIDDVRIWNVAKTPAQINASKNCELQGNETGLLAYYKFNQGFDAAFNNTITTLTDATSNGNNGALSNFTLTSSTSNFLAGSPVVVLPSNPTVTTPVIYTQGDTASALTATTGTNGTGLLWYTTATGGVGSTTAPTPSTVNPGDTSYWVASTNANGCESARTEIVVTINASPTAGCWALIQSCNIHTLAIAQNGTLWGWGDNQYGQLGDGTYVDKNIPTQIGTESNWAALGLGEYHSLAIKSNGTLWAWGDNQFGALGNGTFVSTNTPIQVGTDTDWLKIQKTSYQSHAIKSNGTLWAWGLNNFGQLGDGTTVNKNIPTQIGTSTWDQVFGGYYHTIGIKSNGTLWTWGGNTKGQLGDGTTVNKNAPIQIGTSNWLSVSAGIETSTAIKSDGTLWSWGENSSGEMGDGTGVDKLIPTQVGSSTWTKIISGYFHSVGIRTNGTLWSWGYNIQGQLGDGTTVAKLAPTQIGSNTNWLKLVSGGRFSFAIKTDGTLWSWGTNGNGELGLGDSTQRNSPVEVSCPAVLSADDFITENNVNIYPNPSNGIFTIDAKEVVIVEVYDMIGKKVFNSKITLGSSNLDLSNHANGIYLLQVTTENGAAKSYKLIKQ
jgi:alpha-tubulin suppressor-like RCC1 family protein